MFFQPLRHIALLPTAERRHNPPTVAMDEGRKRVLAIVAGILVARHLKTADDLNDCQPSPRTEYLLTSAVKWGGADHAEDC